MRISPPRAVAVALVLLMVGCDSNPGGPSGSSSPTPPASTEGAAAKAPPTKAGRASTKLTDQPSMKLVD
jgi:hypothetical protein